VRYVSTVINYARYNCSSFPLHPSGAPNTAAVLSLRVSRPQMVVLTTTAAEGSGRLPSAATTSSMRCEIRRPMCGSAICATLPFVGWGPSRIQSALRHQRAIRLAGTARSGMAATVRRASRSGRLSNHRLVISSLFLFPQTRERVAALHDLLADLSGISPCCRRHVSIMVAGHNRARSALR